MIDDVDRVFPAAISVNTEGVATQVAPPSGPIATQRLSEDEVAMLAPEPANPPAFEVEVHGLEPTLLDQRTGRSARLFWLWFAANASILSVALGAIQFSLGMSLRQAIVATLAGVAISFLPLGLGTLAGKWSGQPTMVVSRASFGVVGNVVPAIVAVLSRVFWGGVMIWLLAASVARILRRRRRRPRTRGDRVVDDRPRGRRRHRRGRRLLRVRTARPCAARAEHPHRHPGRGGRRADLSESSTSPPR